MRIGKKRLTIFVKRGKKTVLIIHQTFLLKPIKNNFFMFNCIRMHKFSTFSQLLNSEYCKLNILFFLISFNHFILLPSMKYHQKFRQKYFVKKIFRQKIFRQKIFRQKYFFKKYFVKNISSKNISINSGQMKIFEKTLFLNKRHVCTIITPVLDIQ